MPLNPTIYDYGFDKSLNKPIEGNSTEVVYDIIRNSINTNNILSGGAILGLKNLILGSVNGSAKIEFISGLPSRSDLRFYHNTDAFAQIRIGTDTNFTGNVQITNPSGSAKEGILITNSNSAGIDIVSNSSAGKGIVITQASTDIGIDVSKTNTGTVISVSSTVDSASVITGILMNLANAGAGLEYAFRFNGSEIVAADVGATKDKKIRVSVAGTDYFIPLYTT